MWEDKNTDVASLRIIEGDCASRGSYVWLPWLLWHLPPTLLVLWLTYIFLRPVLSVMGAPFRRDRRRGYDSREPLWRPQATGFGAHAPQLIPRNGGGAEAEPLHAAAQFDPFGAANPRSTFYSDNPHPVYNNSARGGPVPSAPPVGLGGRTGWGLSAR